MATWIVRPVLNEVTGCFDEVRELVVPLVDGCVKVGDASGGYFVPAWESSLVESCLVQWIAAEVAKRASESMDAWFKVEAEPKLESTAKSLPGALDVASGGHRFGGWGATD